MRGDDHERVTLLAIHLVSQNSDSPAVEQLRRIATFVAHFSKLPDAGGESRAHYAYPLDRVLRRLVKVRRAVLEGRVGGREARELGEALHFVQDMFNELRRRATLVEVQGYQELRDLLMGEHPAVDVDEVDALTVSYAVLHAVFAPPSPENPEVRSAAERVWKLFKGWRGTLYAMVAGAGFALCAHSIAAHPQPLAALLLSLPLATYAAAVRATFARSRSELLAALRGLTGKPLAAANAVASLLALALLPPAALGALLPLPVALAAPLLSKSFREIRDEIPWFLWDHQR